MRGFSLEATRPSADDVAALAAIVPAGTRRLSERGADAAGARGDRRGGAAARGRLRAGAASGGAQLRDRPRARRVSRPRQRRGRRAAPAGDRRRSRPARRRLPQRDRGDRRRRACSATASPRSASPAIPTAIRAYRSRTSTARSPTRSVPPRPTGMAVHIVTQFCFDAQAILHWIAPAARLRHRASGADRACRPDQSRDAVALRASAAACGPRPRGSRGRPAWCGSCSPCRRPTRWCARSRAGARRAASRRDRAAFLFVRRIGADRALGRGGGAAAGSRSRPARASGSSRRAPD